MCAVCNICTHGFKVSCAGRTAQRAKFDLRFGEGLYFSSVSGKANDYAELSEKVRLVMFVFVSSCFSCFFPNFVFAMTFLVWLRSWGEGGGKAGHRQKMNTKSPYCRIRFVSLSDNY